jgi:hypothetical protein
MPNPNEYDDEKTWMGVCIPKMVKEGKSSDQAVAACMSMWEHKDDAPEAQKAFEVAPTNTAVKAVGDWELDVLAIPFGGKDSDGQWFDEETDIMPEAFGTPLAVYQHGISQGAQSLQGNLIIVGKTKAGSLEKKSDGWHIRVILNKTIDAAKRLLEAAKNGMIAVSSGSISHLARLDIGGKRIMYEKDRPGRIAVWPFAEISLWEKGNGNMQPANQFAVALPAMKAIYRQAGIRFPDVSDTYGVLSDAEIAAKRAKVTALKIRSKQLLEKINDRRFQNG